MRLIVDGDSCGTLNQIAVLSNRYAVDCYVVANTNRTPLKALENRWISVPVIYDSSDAAIIDMVAYGDIVVTNDVKLAAACHNLGAVPVRDDGRLYRYRTGLDSGVRRLRRRRKMTKAERKRMREINGRLFETQLTRMLDPTDRKAVLSGEVSALLAERAEINKRLIVEAASTQPRKARSRRQKDQEYREKAKRRDTFRAGQEKSVPHPKHYSSFHMDRNEIAEAFAEHEAMQLTRRIETQRLAEEQRRLEQIRRLQETARLTDCLRQWLSQRESDPEREARRVRAKRITEFIEIFKHMELSAVYIDESGQSSYTKYFDKAVRMADELGRIEAEARLSEDEINAEKAAHTAARVSGFLVCAELYESAKQLRAGARSSIINFKAAMPYFPKLPLFEIINLFNAIILEMLDTGMRPSSFDGFCVLYSVSMHLRKLPETAQCKAALAGLKAIGLVTNYSDSYQQIEYSF